MQRRRTIGRFWTVFVLAVIPTLGGNARGQAGIDAPLILPRAAKDLLTPSTLLLPNSGSEMGPPNLRLNFASLIQDVPNSSSRPDRFQLFRMPTGFLSTPVGLDSDDDDPVNELTSPPAPSPGEDRLQVAVGQDNPFFDFRYRGDPGGCGYYRLHAQYQLIDSNSGGLSLGLRAVTPAGLEGDGVAQGRTILCPALAWYQDLGGNFVLHGYVGKNLHASPNWTDNLERSVHYGMALQQPVPGLESSPIGSLHMFVEALGRQRSNPDLVDRPVSTLEMLPGLHWQMGENWWMQGGVLLPLGSSRLDTSLWQITCSWRF
jgi:hypothetical protein